MSMIRLQHKTPEIYSNESRDFQLLERLYDCICNGIQYNISTMPSILNTKKCRDIMLPLLQTKLGFFTRKEIDNYSLRYVLEIFPLLVKNKGSINAIKQALAMFLKLTNIDSSITVYYTKNGLTIESGATIPSNTLVIGINAGFQDTLLLDEIFKYIVPVGVGYYFYFFNNMNVKDKLLLMQDAVLLFTSHNVNDLLRDSDLLYHNNLGTSEENRLIGAVDTMTLAYSNDTIIPTENGTYDAVDMSYFLGIHKSESSFNTYISTLSITPVNNKSLIIFNNDEYAYLGNNWCRLNYLGQVSSRPSSPSTYDVIYYYNQNQNINRFEIYIDNQWKTGADCPVLYLLSRWEEDIQYYG